MTNSTDDDDDDDDEETQHFLTLLQKVRGKLTHRCFLAVLYCSIRKISPNSGYTPLASNLKKAPQVGQGLKGAQEREGGGYTLQLAKEMIYVREHVSPAVRNFG